MTVSYRNRLIVLIFLISEDGGDGVGLGEKLIHVDICDVLYLDLRFGLKDLVHVAWELFVNIFDKLKEVLDLEQKHHGTLNGNVEIISMSIKISEKFVHNICLMIPSSL